MVRRPWIAWPARVWSVPASAGVVSLVAAALVIATTARAAQIVFETVAAPEAQVGTSCPAPCFNVRMFLEDPTRSLEIQAIQFDIAIVAGGTVANLPTPPASSNQAANGNFGGAPWNLSATVGKSPSAGFDALVVNAALELITVNSVQAVFDAECNGGNCSFIGAGLASNRIYLGRFNATLTGTDPSFRVGGITGMGEAIPELRAFHEPDWVPEPPPAATPPPAPLPAPPAELPPISEYPAEDSPVLPYDGPILIGIPCGEGCLDVRPCESEGCTDLLLPRAIAFYTPEGLPVFTAFDGPEPAVALLLLLGTSLIALRRTRR